MYISRRSERYQIYFEKLFKITREIEELYPEEDAYKDQQLLEHLCITSAITNNYINTNQKKGTPIQEDSRNIKLIILTAFIIADKLLNDCNFPAKSILKHSHRSGYTQERISMREFNVMELKLLDYIPYSRILRINVEDSIMEGEDLLPLLNPKYLKEVEDDTILLTC
tara:strand:- start:52 stop:555 length:504 start_codon:yes stop_codon:yes gene_type:complete